MTEDDMIPISALQHYLYCPRQRALIHIEQMWTESADTAQGRLLHKKADAPGIEQRNGVRVERALRLHGNPPTKASHSEVEFSHGEVL